MNGAATEKDGNGNRQLLKNDFFLKRISGRFVAASVFSMIFLFAGSLVDTLLVGAYLGEDGLSAMSLIGPVYLAYYTVGATMGIGGSIAASRMIGQGSREGYLQIFTCSSLMLLLAFFIMTAAGFLLLDPVSALLAGNSGQTEAVRDYLKYYIPGGGFTLLAYIPLYFLKTDGRPKLSSGLFFFSAALNVLLTWVFVSPVCGMGVGGASLATSIAMGAVAVAGFVLLLRGNKNLRFVSGSLSWGIVKRILLAGTPNGLSNLLESLRILLVNTMLLGIGAAAFLPCYTVVRNVSDLLGSVMIGIASALLPLIGVFFGECDHTNVRIVLRIALRLGLCVMTPLVLLVCCFPDALSGLFGVSDPALLAQDRLALPFSCAGLLFAYVNTLNIGFLTATKRIWLANLLVALRLFIFLAVFALILSNVWGAAGIWLSLSLCEAAALLTYYLINLVLRKKHKTFDRYLLDTAGESEDDISFSVKNDIDDIVFSSDKISSFCAEHNIEIKKAMKASLAIEEILTVLIEHCLSPDPEQYIDMRVWIVKDDVMLRFRYMGRIFDPAQYYENNKTNDAMADDLLGLKMIVGSASQISFEQTLGTNNLMIVF